MDLVETKQVMAYIAAAFPKYYASVTKESVNRQAIVWNDAFADYSVTAVMAGVRSYITSDASGFPPSPGQIIEHIHFIGNPRDHSGTEAWALVRKAVNVPWDQFEASFNTLPKAVQIAVGSPRSLEELAKMDIQRFETVAQSNFLRMYDTAKRREAQELKTPKAVLAARERVMLELEKRRAPSKAIENVKNQQIEEKPRAEGVQAPTDRLQALRERLSG